MISTQSVSENPLTATFHLSCAASLNLVWSQNGILGNGLSYIYTSSAIAFNLYLSKKLSLDKEFKNIFPNAQNIFKGSFPPRHKTSDIFWIRIVMGTML